MYVLPNCFRFRYACMFVLNILDAFWRKHVHYIFILFFLGNVISMVYLDFFSLYSPHAAMWFWCNISSRGFFGYQFFMEEPFWWMARGLQIGLWVVYGHVDFSSEGTRHDYGLMIIIIIIFLITALAVSRKHFFGWQKERKKKWDEKNQEEISKVLKNLDEFDQVIKLLLSYLLGQIHAKSQRGKVFQLMSLLFMLIYYDTFVNRSTLRSRIQI